MAISPIILTHHPPPSHPTMSAANTELEQAMHSLRESSTKAKTPQDLKTLYNSLISLCISNNSPATAGRRLRRHLSLHRHRLDPDDPFLDNQFINLYSKRKEPHLAREVFDEIPRRNVVSWNAMISAYSSSSRFHDAAALFAAMVEAGTVAPNHRTYVVALKASASSRNFELGEQIHARILKSSKNLFDQHLELGNALVTHYSRFAMLEDADRVWSRMGIHDAVSYNSLIAVKPHRDWDRDQGRDRAFGLFVGMQEAGLAPDEFTFGSLLKQTEEVSVVEQLHAQIVARGLSRNVFAASTLLDVYGRCGEVRDAVRVFYTMPERNTVTWNSAMDACFDNGREDEGWRIFREMGSEGVVPDKYTISILLKSATVVGKQVHGMAVKMGSHTGTSAGNSLIAMYAERGEFPDSWRAFEDIGEPDLITWNSITQSCILDGNFERALGLFLEMKRSGFKPDRFSFVGVLSACASMACLRTGSALHGDLIKSGLVSDDFVESALIDMYSKSNATADAKLVFEGIERKDPVAWNSMIAAFAQNGDLREALSHLCLMREDGLRPDSFTFSSALSATANSVSVRQGRQIHALILKSETATDAAVTNALIAMYARSGSSTEASKVFSGLEPKNVVSWTSMIGGFAQSGRCEEAVKLFDQMEMSGTEPNTKTFVALLTACSYSGLREEGERYFEMMNAKYGIKPGFEHYACMVDILGRAGKLDEAEEMIRGMPFEPDALVWRMLLSACRARGDLERGRLAMGKIMELEPGDSAAYVLMSNLYASVGDWDGVAGIRRLMRERQVRKEPANSWIEVGNEVHEFMAGNRSHPRDDEICAKVRELERHMKDEGDDTHVLLHYLGEN